MRLIYAVIGATVLFGSAVGCGASSTSFTGDPGGSSGKGGSGDTGGEAGDPGSGGTGGSRASGGSSGKSGSSGGTGGSAGVGGMRGYRPPQSQVDGCTSICQREAEAMCENETTLERCIGDCRVAILFEDCSAEWDAVLECAEDAEVSCDDAGEATFSSCITPYASAVACVFGDGLDTDFEAPCSDFCAASAVPACENADSEADCTEGCILAASAFPVCNDTLTAQLTCGSDAEFTCSDAGEPEAAECLSEALSFLACVVTEYDFEP